MVNGQITTNNSASLSTFVDSGCASVYSEIADHVEYSKVGQNILQVSFHQPKNSYTANQQYLIGALAFRMLILDNYSWYTNLLKA